jgi:hypothetical protein
MSIYSELLTRAMQTYKDGSNGFRPADTAAKVRAAAEALAGPLNRLDAQIAKYRQGLYADPMQFKRDSDDSLLLADADFETLRTILTTAGRTDRAKAGSIIVDQPVAVRRFSEQLKADQTLVAQATGIIARAKADAAAAGETPEPGGSGPMGFSPADEEAFEKALADRASPKEDAIVAQQIHQLGGQAVEI